MSIEYNNKPFDEKSYSEELEVINQKLGLLSQDMISKNELRIFKKISKDNKKYYDKQIVELAKKLENNIASKAELGILKEALKGSNEQIEIVKNDIISKDELTQSVSRSKQEFYLITLILSIISTIVLTIFLVFSIVYPNKEDYTFYLPASRHWMETGIEFERGDEIEVFISGGTHLALGDLVYSVIDHKYAKKSHKWRFYPYENSIDRNEKDGHDGNGAIGGKNPFYHDLVFTWGEVRDSSYYRVVPMNQSDDKMWNESKIMKASRTGSLSVLIWDNYIEDKKNYIKKYDEEYFNRLRKMKSFLNKGSLTNEEKNNINAEVVGDYLLKYGGYPPIDEEEYDSMQNGIWNEYVGDIPNIFYRDNIGGYLITVKVKKGWNWVQWILVGLSILGLLGVAYSFIKIKNA